MTKKKLLILTYYWPPAGGAGVQRWLKFVKYLVDFGYEIHVYTAENPEAPAFDNSLLEDIPSGITVIKKPIWEPFEFYKKITRRKGNFNAGFLTEDHRNKSSLADKISLFIRANFFIPDAKMFWINPSVRFLKKYIVQEKIDVVISSGPPHSLHIIASKLKKQLKINWLADFRDPWTNIDFYKELPVSKPVHLYHKYLEKKVLRQADRVVVVGETMKSEFLEISPTSRIDVITNGFDIEPSASKNLDGDFTILHVGSINADRSHESFYKTLRELCHSNQEFAARLKLKFIGKTDYKARQFIKKYELESLTQFIDYLPYNEIAAIQSSARILYLPVNNSLNAKGILTGKFFEYLAALRPILAQGPVNGDIAKILEQTQAGVIVDFEDLDGMKTAINKEFNGYLENSVASLSQNVDSFSRKNLTRQLHEILESM